MTDRELLEMAAKAAGLELDYSIRPDGKAFYHSDRNAMALADGGWFAPLTDDGDALRLAVKLAFINPGCFPSPSLDMERMIHTGETPDWYAATRRAIVRAAAELGR